MKVAHIFWSLSFGGIETMMINIANAQALLNADVHIVLLNNLYEEELLKKIDKRVTVHLINRKAGSKGVSFIFRLNRLLEKMAPDAIHLHLSKFYKLIWSEKLRRATFVTLHALPRGSVRRGDILLRLFPFFSPKDTGNVVFIDQIPKVFAISEAVKDELLQKYGINSAVVNNGIMTRSFKHRSSKKPGEQLSVIMVSRLEHEKKGQDLLIRAAAALQGKIHVTFVGDGSSRMFLEQLAIELKADQWISFLGSRTQAYIAEHLCEYDLFVQPSRREGFGLTVAEAMASKVPVLVSNGQGPAEVTCGDKYGWLFENGDSDKLMEQIDYIVKHYDEALIKAEKALQYVCDIYDVSVTARMYLKLYKIDKENQY